MVKAAVKIGGILFFLIWSLCLPVTGNAQENKEEIKTDTIEIAAADSLIHAVLEAADSSFVPILQVPEQAFKPNPTRAVLYAFVPGMGQIYNRKYWKLPLVYGGFMGFMYAITWNNKMYQDYLDTYKSIMIDKEIYQQLIKEGSSEAENYKFNEKWTIFIGTSGDPRSEVSNTTLHSRFKSRKDYYRRYRDLSIILGVGFYALTIIDAYVDAQLFDFDISPDLTMRVEPAYSPQTRYSERTFGLNCSITF